MDKTKLWIDLSDRQYASHLREYLARYYEASLDPVLTDHETWREQAPGGGMLLTDEALSGLDQQRAKEKFSSILYVSETDGINPYQNAREIASQILERERHENREQAGRTRDAAKGPETGGALISVYSPIGGVGKTSVALALSEELVREGKVLYFSTESFDGWSPLLSYEGPLSLTDLCYSLLAEPDASFVRRVQSLPQKQKGGYYFLPPSRCPDDLASLGADGAQELLTRLCGAFDFIVADLGVCLLETYRAMLSSSRRRVYLLQDSPEGRLRFSRALLPEEDPRDILLLRRGRGQRAARTAEGLREETLLPEEDSLMVQENGTWQWNKNTEWYRTMRTLSFKLSRPLPL